MSVYTATDKITIEFDRWGKYHSVFIGLTKIVETDTKYEATAIARILRKALREAKRVGRK